MQGQTKITNAFQLGLLGGLGVLTAIVIGGAVQTLANIITYVAAAIFIALGLDPIVSKLESFNLKRSVSILIVVAVLLGGIGTLIWAILPTLASQGAHFIATAPAVIAGFGDLPLVVRLDNQLGGAISNAISSTSAFLSDSANWPKMLGGVVQVGVNIFNGFFAGIVILILSLYFMASLNRFKAFVYSLVPASKREKFHDIAEQVATSVGRYVIGQFSIAMLNAILSYIFMTLTGIPFGLVLAFIVLLLGLIPLVGTITGAAIVTLVALSVSPTTALIAAIYYLIYMQIEAYIVSPRIMNKAVAIPGAVVVVAALSGGALLGVLGALVAIPVAASAILIIRQILVPHQDAK
jgi:predicted PurR-regulated permease PerM